MINIAVFFNGVMEKNAPVIHVLIRSMWRDWCSARCIFFYWTSVGLFRSLYKAYSYAAYPSTNSPPSPCSINRSAPIILFRRYSFCSGRTEHYVVSQAVHSHGIYFPRLQKNLLKSFTWLESFVLNKQVQVTQKKIGSLFDGLHY